MASLMSSPAPPTKSLPAATLSSFSPSFSASPKLPQFSLYVRTSHLEQQWVGLSLKHLGISVSRHYVCNGKKGRCKGSVVRASLFGVGAPEALVIGVVALLVFGPKGLAEVARNLGKTLRAFQPTIRELQDVSREFKSTLEREIGLDEMSSQMPNTYNSNRPNTPSPPSPSDSTENPPTMIDPNGSSSPNRPYTSEEYLKITEEQLKASSAHQLAQLDTQGESQHEPPTQLESQATIKETAGATPPRKKPENEV